MCIDLQVILYKHPTMLGIECQLLFIVLRSFGYSKKTLIDLVKLNIKEECILLSETLAFRGLWYASKETALLLFWMHFYWNSMIYVLLWKRGKMLWLQVVKYTNDLKCYICLVHKHGFDVYLWMYGCFFLTLSFLNIFLINQIHWKSAFGTESLL